MDPKSYRFGHWTVDPRLNRIVNGKAEEHLEPKVMEVLCYLLDHPGDIVTQDELLERVWAGRVVEPAAVARNIGLIRQALGDDPRQPTYIVTIPKRGYQVIAPVTVVNGQPDSPAADLSPPPAATGRGRHWRWSLLVLALVVPALGAWWLWLAPRVDGDRPPTIAVLPLKNLSGDDGQAYFGDAVSSEIWTKLARVDGLRVISMTSSSAYRESDLDIREIARRLTADLVVEGAVMKRGNLARVNVHLTDAEDGTEIWGEQFARSIDGVGDLFALYDAIAAEIGRSLPSHIHGTDVLNASSSVPTDNMAAYNLLRQAWYEFGRTADARESLRLARQAAALDPQYADAHAAVAMFNLNIPESGYGHPRAHLIAAEAAARRALAVDPTWGYAYVPLAYVYDRLHLDWARAMDAYEKAEALGVPADHIRLAGWKADLLLNAGRYEEGLKLLREAAARNPGHGWWGLLMGRFLYRLGRTDEALETLEEGLRLYPTSSVVVTETFNHYLRMGKVDFAEQVYCDYIEPVREGHVARALLSFVRDDDPAPLREVVTDFVANRGEQYVRASTISNIYWLLRDYEAYMRWFAIRVEERDIVGWVMDDMTRRPNYKEDLERWAQSDPDQAAERARRVNDHLALLARTTEKMVL